MNNSDIALFMEEILCSLCKQHLLIAEKADDLKTRIAHGGNVPLRWMMVTCMSEPTRQEISRWTRKSPPSE